MTRSLKSKEAFKALMREAKDRPCTDCDKRYPYYVMDFDHRPDEEKRFNIGGRETQGLGFEVMRAEIAKCDVVCANCHRERSHRRRYGTPS
jgi:hypothetical protein